MDTVIEPPFVVTSSIKGWAYVDSVWHVIEFWKTNYDSTFAHAFRCILVEFDPSSQKTMSHVVVGLFRTNSA